MARWGWSIFRPATSASWECHGVVDQHLLAHGDVELVGDEVIDDVPRQGRIAGDRARHRNCSAFVFVAVLFCRAHREGRHLVEEEIEPMVVGEHHGDVGLIPRQRPMPELLQTAQLKR